MYACVPPMCLTSTEVTRGCWIPLEPELQMAVRGHVDTGNPGPLQELHVFLATETSLQSLAELFIVLQNIPNEQVQAKLDFWLPLTSLEILFYFLRQFHVGCPDLNSLSEMTLNF